VTFIGCCRKETNPLRGTETCGGTCPVWLEASLRRKETNPLRGTETRSRSQRDSISISNSLTPVEKRRIPFGGLKRVPVNQKLEDFRCHVEKRRIPFGGLKRVRTPPWRRTAFRRELVEKRRIPFGGLKPGTSSIEKASSLGRWTSRKETNPLRGTETKEGILIGHVLYSRRKETNPLRGTETSGIRWRLRSSMRCPSRKETNPLRGTETEVSLPATRETSSRKETNPLRGTETRPSKQINILSKTCKAR
jgi:hypothetical protein